ncbi:MAG: ribosome-binding factor A [Candidatus Peribacteraceae bacterium]
MTSFRPTQLADRIRAVVGRFAAQVPPSVATLVSVTGVTLTPDLAFADVMISAIQNPKEAVSYLKREHMREMKKQLSAEFLAFRIPILRFHTDETGRKTHELETLIDSLR